MEHIHAGTAFIAIGPDNYVSHRLRKNEQLEQGSHVLLSRSTDGKCLTLRQAEEGEVDDNDADFPTLAAFVRTVNQTSRTISVKSRYILWPDFTIPMDTPLPPIHSTIEIMIDWKDVDDDSSLVVSKVVGVLSAGSQKPPVREILALDSARSLAEHTTIDTDLSASALFSPLLAPESFLDLVSREHSSFADLEEKLLTRQPGADKWTDAVLQERLTKGIHSVILVPPKLVGLYVPRLRTWLEDINKQQLAREITVLIETDPTTDEQTLLNHAATDLTDSRSFPQLSCAAVLKEPLHVVPVDEDGNMCGPGRIQHMAALTYSIRPAPVLSVKVTTINNSPLRIPAMETKALEQQAEEVAATVLVLLDKADPRATKLTMAPNCVPMAHPLTRSFSCTAITFETPQDQDNFVTANKSCSKGKMLLAPARHLLSRDDVFTARLANTLTAEQIDSLYAELRADWIYPMSSRKIRFSTKAGWSATVAAVNTMNSVVSAVLSLHDDRGQSFVPVAADPLGADIKRAHAPVACAPPQQTLPKNLRETIILKGFPVHSPAPLIMSSVSAAFPSAENIRVIAMEGTLCAVCSVGNQEWKGIAPIIKVGNLFLSLELLTNPPPRQPPHDARALAMSLLNPG